LIADVSCDAGIRKAVALTEYVRLLSKYSTDERFSSQDIPSWQRPPRPPPISIRPDVRERLEGAGADAMLLMNAQELGVSNAQFLLHHEYARLFTDILSYVRAEMLVCGDTTLASSNQNIVETVTRIIDVEKSELMSMLAAARPSLQQSSGAAAAVIAPANDGTDSSSSSDDDDDDRNPSADTPASFICPISHMIFKDPVIAADDNTCVLYAPASHPVPITIRV